MEHIQRVLADCEGNLSQAARCGRLLSAFEWLESSDDMMRDVPRTFGKLLIAAMLTLCVGVQVLEATGQWDRAIKDTDDEAIIVVLVLCVGAALAAAAGVLTRISLARAVTRLRAAVPTAVSWPTPRFDLSASRGSPPVSLRI